VYAKSLVVVALCTIFVLAFALVLNYEAASVNSQLQALPTSTTSCSGPDDSCPGFTIVSAALSTTNTTDQLGIANPIYLSVDFNVSANPPLSRVSLFVGNISAGTVEGPFQLGPNRIVNQTLPTTVQASPGKAYLVSVVAFNSGGYTMRSVNVTDRLSAPPSS